MRSIYPDDIVQAVLGRLDALDVLELLDYHPESMQRDRTKVRMFCPIHRERTLRTLTVYVDRKIYACSNPGCAGSEGGDLIDLLAKAERTDYDTALRRVVDEFSLDVELPRDQEAVNQALVEAENLLVLVSMRDGKQATHATEAHARLDRVLDENPSNILALRLKMRVLQETNASLPELTPWIIRVAEAEDKAGDTEAAREVLETELFRNAHNLEVRRRLADRLRDAGDMDGALEQYLLLAETAEANHALPVAIDAYRQIQGLGDTGFDAGVMITQLLLASTDREAAVGELIKQAYTFQEQGKPDDAVHALEAALEIEPNNPRLATQLVEAWIGRGLRDTDMPRVEKLADSLIERRDWSTALKVLESAAGGSPEHPGVLSRLARIHRQHGSPETAVELLRRLARIHRANQEYDAAREALDTILELIPQDLNALRSYGEVAREQGDTEAAIVHFRTLAQACEGMGNADGALLARRQMAEAAPGDPRVVLDLVAALLKVENKDEAITVLENATRAISGEDRPDDLREIVEQGLRLAEDNPLFLLRKGTLLDHEGDRESALDYALRGCRALIDRDQAEEAEQHLREVLSRMGMQPAAAVLLADALAALDRSDDAIRELRAGADALVSRNDYANARQLLEKINSLDPLDSPALDQLVIVNTKLDDKPQVVWTHERLMLLHKQKRRYPEAIRHGRQLLALDPEHVEGHRELMELYKLNGESTQWMQGSWRLVRLYRGLDQPDMEKMALRQLLEADPADLDARERMVELTLPRGDGEALAETIEHYFEQCDSDGQWQRAVDFLRKLADEHPSHTLVQKFLVRALGNTSDTSEQARRLATLVDDLEKRNEIEEALPHLRELIALQPAESKWRDQLTRFLLRLERAPEAAAHLVQCALHLLRTADHDEAEKLLLQAVELDSEAPGAHRGLADICIVRGRDEEAISHLLDHAQSLVAAEKFNEALDVLTEAAGVNPSRLTPRRRRVAVLLHEKVARRDDAVEELRRIAQTHLQRGEEEAGFQAHREALVLAPGQDERRREVIGQMMARGRPQEAVEVLADGAEHSIEENDPTSALAWCEEALATDPAHLRTRSLRAQAFELKGDRNRALEEWRSLAPLLKGGGASGGARQSSAMPATLSIMREYTFDHFVVGDRNRFAWATARAVAQAPGRTPHNPLFLYSDVGLGKTHLLHAIANHVLTSSPASRVVYTSAEDFTTELIEAIQTNTVGRFRQTYKQTDLLLIDDVHFLAGKERAQEEFFHIFNALSQSGSQIVVTSDRPPREIARLEARLLSRFGSGVIVDIQQPELETRLAILKRTCADQSDTQVPVELLALIAEGIPSNVRELKAALNQLLLLHRNGGRDLNAETAREAIAVHQPATPSPQAGGRS